MKRVLAGLALLVVGTSAAAVSASQPLVDAAWLRESLDQVVVLDVRSVAVGDPAAAFAAGHVPGAVYGNYLAAGWRTTVDGIVGQLPPLEDLERLIGGLGIGNDDRVVIVHGGVDSTDFGSATRVYWTFKVTGHDAVSILDGGWRAWTADPANPIETGPARPRAPKRYVAAFQPQYYASTEDVAKAMAGDAAAALVDARPEAQHLGREKAAPVGVPGTIPGAVNLPHGAFVDTASGKAKDAARVASLLRAAGLQPRGEQITFCNTGHWASIAWFVLSEVAGNDKVRMYDGSMAEWTANPTRPVEVRAD